MAGYRLRNKGTRCGASVEDQRDGGIHREWLDIAYVTRELDAVRQSRCVSNKMIATMRKQIRTLDYRSSQHYMTVCGPNKYFVARTDQ